MQSVSFSSHSRQLRVTFRMFPKKHSTPDFQMTDFIQLLSCLEKFFAKQNMSGVPVVTMETLWNFGWLAVSDKQDISVLSKLLCLWKWAQVKTFKAI